MQIVYPTVQVTPHSSNVTAVTGAVITRLENARKFTFDLTGVELYLGIFWPSVGLDFYFIASDYLA